MLTRNRDKRNIILNHGWDNVYARGTFLSNSRQVRIFQSALKTMYLSLFESCFSRSMITQAANTFASKSIFFPNLNTNLIQRCCYSQVFVLKLRSPLSRTIPPLQPTM
ncbi:unnamed protein product [Blumeria hordei]|uniref:Uncharacterized protein n=1 Tax=Blumeria hordei TaxID=2867405 RepID=A0A383UUN6_BLUHO|nr:unnamed protein product [Blumeria hordei]